MSGRTRLTVVVFEDDPFASLYHQWCMFDHLAAGNLDARMVILGGDDAPHDAYIAAPAALVSALQPVWQR
jgi:hypothetical protein